MNANMAYGFTETELDIARHTDLPDLLSSLGYTLKRIGSYYTTAEMDSIRIKERLTWRRYSTRQGGDAISFLQEFCGMRFPEAVDYLLAYHGRSRDSPDRDKPIPRPKPSPPKEKPPFVLPPANPDQRRVSAYLRKRGIASQVIQRFLDTGLLYEDAPYHNCVFVGRDGSGQPKFASKRGTMDFNGSGFKRDVLGSDKKVGFRLPCEPEIEEVTVFEAPIDLMSFCTLCPEVHSNAVALCGLYSGPLDTYLRDHPHLKSIKLLLDHDEPGITAAKTIRFTDINYAIASKEDKTSMFLGYSELLNALDTGSTTKITINNKRLNRQNFEQEILIPRQDDYLDGYRAEYNSMLMDKVTDSSNSVVQERYVTLSVHRKNVEEARAFFDRVTADVTTRLSHLDAHSEELDAVERLRVLHDFYRTGEEAEYRLDLRDLMRKGHSFKDSICPDSLEFKKDHFVMGGKFGRVLFLKEYASYIKDSMISELTALNRSMMLSIDVIPVPTDEAVREMQNRLLGVETNVTNWQRRQNSNNNFSAVVPYDLDQQRKETREMLDDLTTRDQRMMFAVVTLVHLADSKEELDSDTETLQSAARKHLCQLATLNWQQADGLTTALPMGLRRIDALRTLTTEALAVLMPFKAQEIRDQGGIYYGQNVISKNLIVANRKELLNGNGFVLGVSGSGKSFTAKEEIAGVALSTEDDIIVIDPESEYGPLIEGLGGEVVNISATSRNHINAMDMEQGYGDGENPVVLKSEFLLSLCEQLVGSGKLSAKEKSIIDR